MDINEYQLATKTLLKCLKQLKDVENSNEEEELRRISIELCVTFNLAISY